MDKDTINYIIDWIPEFNDEHEMKLIYDYFKAKNLSDDKIYSYIVDNNENLKKLIDEVKDLDINYSDINKEEYENFISYVENNLKKDRSKTPGFNKMIDKIYSDNKDLIKRLT